MDLVLRRTGERDRSEWVACGHPFPCHFRKRQRKRGAYDRCHQNEWNYADDQQRSDRNGGGNAGYSNHSDHRKKIIVKESRQDVKNLVKLFKKEINCNL